jgi:hypothetical protein
VSHFAQQVLEEEKQKNLTGKQHKGSAPHNNAPGWNEYLASTSEAYTKADKSDGETTEALTKKTIERIKHRHNPDDVMEGMESSDVKDEVEGPLKKFGKAAGEVVDKMANAVSGKETRAGEGRPRHWDSERSTPSEAAVCGFSHESRSRSDTTLTIC